jgi:hypothetical protein
MFETLTKAILVRERGMVSEKSFEKTKTTKKVKDYSTKYSTGCNSFT